MVIWLWKNICFFFSFFLKKILYLWHCAVVASKRARKQWPGPVPCQQAHTPKLQCCWLDLPSRANRVILDKINKSDFLENHPISILLHFYLFYVRKHESISQTSISELRNLCRQPNLVIFDRIMWLEDDSGTKA